jgi:hypothetical protein
MTDVPRSRWRTTSGASSSTRTARPSARWWASSPPAFRPLGRNSCPVLAHACVRPDRAVFQGEDRQAERGCHQGDPPPGRVVCSALRRGVLRRHVSHFISVARHGHRGAYSCARRVPSE